MSHETKTSFEQAAHESPGNLLSQLAQMLRHNKKYWLVPLIAALLVFGLLIILGGTAAAPFIYTLF
jgi:hypothetical protein